MKKILLIILVITALFCLSSCKSHWYPDMREYSEDEVLAVAAEKYGVSNWIFTGFEFHGKVSRDESGALQVVSYTRQIGTSFVNGDNLDEALVAFAGKNGSVYWQRVYENFISYVALGECEDGKIRYIYYNVNILKNKQISDTVGASDYFFDVSPYEIDATLLKVPDDWAAMAAYMDIFKDLIVKGFDYSGDRLMLTYDEQDHSVVQLEFYKENGEIVYDMVNTAYWDTPVQKRLIYSTSDRYGVIYKRDGLEDSEYFNVTSSLSQSSELESCMLLMAEVELKEISGTVLYSRICYTAKYYAAYDGELTENISNDSVEDVTKFNKGYLIEKIDGIDHAETAVFYLTDYYILYEKTTSKG